MRSAKLLGDGFLIAVLLTSSMLIIPSARSWVYQDGTPEDALFEMFGPRADRLLIRLYENENAGWAALAKGEIDIADSSLSKTYYDLFTSNVTNPDTGLPYNETIDVVNYGAEFNLCMLDVNNNKEEYLGYPPDPADPNPVYPNPTSVKEMRQAIAHLVNRSWFDMTIGKGFYEPIYTVVPPCEGAFSHPEIKPGGALVNISYPYSRVEAEVLLDSGGFPVNASTGWRFWDRNSNGVEESDEYLELKFYIRNDHQPRRDFGTLLADELNATHVRVDRIYASSGTCFVEVILNKDFHLYTGSMSVGVEPDHLALWVSDWIWYWYPHPENYIGVRDPEFDLAVGLMFYADSMEESIQWARLAQRIFAKNAYSVPLWSGAGGKAVNRFYTGGNTWNSVSPDDGENKYRGKYWEGLVNRKSYGIDNFWSFLNMHSADHEKGDGENMTVRWGFRVNEVRMLNPVYSSWFFEWNVLNLIYEPLMKRCPNDIVEFIPWLTEDYEVGNYVHPVFGLCTKVRFTLRPDVFWSDGAPLTVADVHFTLVELNQILTSRGLANPWWYRNVADILGFKILDPYNFEILYGAYTAWVLSWLSDTPILPKHVWKPIAETGSIQGFAPDSDMIGSGPWRFKEYVENSHLLLATNSPNSTVQTNLPDSTPVTSTKGYHRYHPFSIETRVNGTTSAKIDYYAEAVKLDYTIHNLYLDGTITLDILITYPNGSISSETGVAIPPFGNWTHSWTGKIKGVKATCIDVNITYPIEFRGSYSWSHVFYGTLITSGGWVPDYIPGLDICGSTLYDDIGLPDYPYKSQLPTPDIKGDIKDVAVSAKAFGSYPGHPRWGIGIGDTNNDYKIDIKDIAAIAKSFGWVG